MNIFKTWKQPTVYKEMDNILQKGTVSKATRPMLTVNKPRPGVMGDLGIDPLKTGLPLLEPMHELMPPEGLKVYDKMRKNDPVVGGLVLLLSATLKRLIYDFEGPEAKVVQEMLENTTHGLSRIIDEFTSALYFGYYLGEEIWEPDGFGARLIDIEPRYQPTINYINDANGNVVQYHGAGVAEIPYSKCIHHMFFTENRSPFGISILRHLYKPYYYKISTEATEAMGIDRDLAGLPMMTAPEGFDFTAADPDSPSFSEEVAVTLDWAVNIVSNIRKDQQQGIVKPHGWDFQILRGENRSEIPTTHIISRYNTEMAMGVLANFISLGAFATTNNANTQLHATNFISACESYASAIANTFNRQVITKICKYNGIKNQPKIKLRIPNYGELSNIGKFISDLVKAGAVIPTETLEKAMLELLNIDFEKTEGDRYAKPKQKTNNPKEDV